MDPLPLADTKTEIDVNSSHSKIRKLDVSVVNRIAAGEIIVQPANALKEMLENSIDANATTIEVMTKDGGLKLLQITDNGCGIHKDDLNLLCERFATSKLRSFGDLPSISTYGFRGEALASISHISHLSVVSKVPSSPLAYKSFYLNGKLCSAKFKIDPSASSPKPVAGKDGTQITVEDLFYNSTSRLRALKSKNDEWAKILDVVGKYAVHTDGVGFTCKKFGDSLPAVFTRPQASLKERIRTVFGTSVASDLIEFDMKCADYGLNNFKGAVSGFNYDNKRRISPVFFINNRLVACDPLKKAISSVFSTFLPKGNHPFVYFSLDIDSHNIDVNVHPTKREVGFLYEDEIIEWISGQLSDLLFARQGSRTYKQSTLKRSSDGIAMDEIPEASKKYRQENKLVRTDVTQSKINQFIKPDSAATAETTFIVDVDEITVDAPFSQEIVDNSGDTQVPLSSQNKFSQTIFERERVEVNLGSIIELREELGQSIHRPLTNIFNNLVGVGVIDAYKRLSCFQYDVKFFLCDYGAVLYEFYYQVALADFANFGEFVLDPPLDLRQILEPLYTLHEDLEDIEVVVANIVAMKEMYSEYFQIEVSDTTLSKLPMLLQKISPSESKLSCFIYKLGAVVDYSDEKRCFESILRQIALLYVPDRIPRGENEEDSQTFSPGEDAISSKLEHIIYPELRRRFIAPEKLLDQVVQVADLPGLYKVFERC